MIVYLFLHWLFLRCLETSFNFLLVSFRHSLLFVEVISTVHEHLLKTALHHSEIKHWKLHHVTPLLYQWNHFNTYNTRALFWLLIRFAYFSTCWHLLPPLCNVIYSPALFIQGNISCQYPASCWSRELIFFSSLSGLDN